jgi:hypothetical protein
MLPCSSVPTTWPHDHNQQPSVIPATLVQPYSVTVLHQNQQPSLSPATMVSVTVSRCYTTFSRPASLAATLVQCYSVMVLHHNQQPSLRHRWLTGPVLRCQVTITHQPYSHHSVTVFHLSQDFHTTSRAMLPCAWPCHRTYASSAHAPLPCYSVTWATK